MLWPLVVAGILAAEPAALSSQEGLPPVIVSTRWLAQHLHDSRLRIFQADWPQDSAFKRRHIPGAQFLPLEDIAVASEGLDLELAPVPDLQNTFQRLGVTDSSWVVIYGAPTWMAARAFFTLDYMGLKHVAVLNGGLTQWVNEGNAVTTGVPAFPAGSLTLHPKRDAVVGADWVRAHMTDKGMTLLDTRSVEEYTGTLEHRGMNIRGHIPGARLVVWEDLVRDTSADLFLRDSAALAAYYRQRTGATDSVTTYCHIGARASISYLVARYLGYDARLYDGSYQDWAKRGYPLKASLEP